MLKNWIKGHNNLLHNNKLKSFISGSLIYYCVKDYCGLLFNCEYTFVNECFFLFWKIGFWHYFAPCRALVSTLWRRCTSVSRRGGGQKTSMGLVFSMTSPVLPQTTMRFVLFFLLYFPFFCCISHWGTNSSIIPLTTKSSI